MYKACILLGSSWLLFLAASRADAQTYDTNTVMVRTLAGSGQNGSQDGQGTQAIISYPSPIVADSSGNLFVLASSSTLIRKITPSGVVSTIDPGLQAYGFTIDHSDTIWELGQFAPALGGNLLELASDGTIRRSFLDLFTWSANGGDGLCVDSSNRLYIAGLDKIYRYSNGSLEVFAGSGNQSSVDGNWIFSSFNLPSALAIDQQDNVYVWEHGSHLIRKINQNRDVVTIAGKSGVAVDIDGPGTQASFRQIVAMRVDNEGNLVLACGTSIRKMSPQTNVVTIAGSFSQAGFADGPGASARFNGANGICIYQGTLFVSDMSNHRIRSISFNEVPELVGATNLTAASYAEVAITGVVGTSYEVQSSPDLQVWQPEAKILLNSSPAYWHDTNALVRPKFYRTVSLPR